MGNVDKTIDAVWRRKRIIGLILLAVGALIYLTGSAEPVLSFLGASAGLVAFLLMIGGIILLVARGRSRQT